MPEPITGRLGGQLKELSRHAGFGVKKRRQIYGIYLLHIASFFLLGTNSNQVLILQHLVHGHDNKFFLRIQQLRSLGCQLLLTCIHMSLIRQLAQGIHNAASQPHKGFFSEAQL